MRRLLGAGELREGWRGRRLPARVRDPLAAVRRADDRPRAGRREGKISDSFSPFAACHFRIKYATERWELEGAAALRRQVFCDEQKIFATDDRDETDDAAIHLVALSTMAVLADEVVGTVRIHENEPGIWYGSRLAVDRRYRRVGALGAALIKLAVCSANSIGCTRFYGNIQAAN